MSHSNKSPGLFVWRDSVVLEGVVKDHTKSEPADLPSTYSGYRLRCPFCRGEYSAAPNWWDQQQCTVCGFWYRAEFHFENPEARPSKGGYLGNTLGSWEFAGIRWLDINCVELGLEELATHLKSHFKDAYSLEPRRLEEIVAEVFRDDHREPVLTKPTRDGGLDFFLINTETQEVDAVVEVKRYSSERKVGIGAVQRLVGVAIEWQVSRAYLVTTSGYSSDAKKSASRVQDTGVVDLDLISATELSKMLGIYNVKLPRLDQLRPEMVR